MSGLSSENSAGSPAMAEWECSMQQVGELEIQCAHARKVGDRLLMSRLLPELRPATLQSDLLLARAVADARRLSLPDANGPTPKG